PGHVLLRQQSLLDEEVEADQERVARESGEALVGRVAVARGAERQHLPQPLLRPRHEVEQPHGLVAELADAVGAGQRRRMEEDPADARGGGGGQGVLGGGGGGRSRAGHRESNPILLWVPSQNGLLADCPQRQSETTVGPGRPKVLPSWSVRTLFSPSLRVG